MLPLQLLHIPLNMLYNLLLHPIRPLILPLLLFQPLTDHLLLKYFLGQFLHRGLIFFGLGGDEREFFVRFCLDFLLFFVDLGNGCLFSLYHAVCYFNCFFCHNDRLTPLKLKAFNDESSIADLTAKTPQLIRLWKKSRLLTATVTYRIHAELTHFFFAFLEN
jgi:hypothetical protein